MLSAISVLRDAHGMGEFRHCLLSFPDVQAFLKWKCSFGAFFVCAAMGFLRKWKSSTPYLSAAKWLHRRYSLFLATLCAESRTTSPWSTEFCIINIYYCFRALSRCIESQRQHHSPRISRDFIISFSWVIALPRLPAGTRMFSLVCFAIWKACGTGDGLAHGDSVPNAMANTAISRDFAWFCAYMEMDVKHNGFWKWMTALLIYKWKASDTSLMEPFVGAH